MGIASVAPRIERGADWRARRQEPDGGWALDRVAPKRSRVVNLGEDAAAVDATAARLMTIEPTKVPYLKIAANSPSNVERQRIVQMPEESDAVPQDFRVIEPFRNLKRVQG
jgi:uncharacterized protein (DUF362 family)